MRSEGNRRFRVDSGDEYDTFTIDPDETPQRCRVRIVLRPEKGLYNLKQVYHDTDEGLQTINMRNFSPQVPKYPVSFINQ